MFGLVADQNRTYTSHPRAVSLVRFNKRTYPAFDSRVKFVWIMTKVSVYMFSGPLIRFHRSLTRITTQCMYYAPCSHVVLTWVYLYPR